MEELDCYSTTEVRKILSGKQDRHASGHLSLLQRPDIKVSWKQQQPSPGRTPGDPYPWGIVLGHLPGREPRPANVLSQVKDYKEWVMEEGNYNDQLQWHDQLWQWGLQLSPV